ncbi:type I restriction-modification system subunit M [Myxococcota bacterium]|nr:type I restriction-modification system subunit M [Myxococcota bacterium]
MARTRRAASAPALTTPQRLGGLLKSCRDIMRKDRGTDTDAARLPQLTWLFFLKFLDDLEVRDEETARLARRHHVPMIPAPYRWRDWAADPTGMTGDALIQFIGGEKVCRPDGTEGPGLLKTLRGLAGEDAEDRRAVIAKVFSGTTNRMIDGYLLRDLLAKVDGIHFNSTEELHTLGALYEGMLREMRDAAGAAGEFYTPRPLVRLIVQVVDPKLGEVVLDPACGTAGFLVEAFTHMRPATRTHADRERLHQGIRGQEAKPLPYLLAQMNLLLHGVDVPRVEYGNSLAVKMSELGEDAQVDVILTNPPFGGEETAGIPLFFPVETRTSETALLFLQLIVRRLRAAGPGGRGGRAAVIVPNGTLFGDGVCAKVKRELLRECHLHTVLRLPPGVFAPYTSIATNVLFFEAGRPTQEIWFYEHPLPGESSGYTKTKPLRFEEFEPLLAWWTQREEGERAWRIDWGAEHAAAEAKARPLLDRARSLQREAKRERDGARQMKADGDSRVDVEAALARAKEIDAKAAAAEAEGDAAYWPVFNLDRKNPRAVVATEERTPTQIVEEILARERRIVELMEEVRAALGEGWV